jgi:outer membrane protein
MNKLSMTRGLLKKRDVVCVGLLFVIGVAISFLSCARYISGEQEDYIGPQKLPAVTKTAEAASLTTPTLRADLGVKSLTELTSGPLKLSVTDATLLTLEHNRSLSVQRFNPDIQRTAEQQQRAVFDPVLTGAFSLMRQRTRSEPGTVGGPSVTREQQTNASLGLSEFLPTGTNLGLGLSTNRTETKAGGVTTDQNASAVSLSATQALLRGFGLNVNLASLRQARLDTRVSQYELRGFAESLVAQVEETYWDYALARQQIGIVTDALNVAEQQLRETEERINVGKLAGVEIYAAQAEVALRREDLINANSTLTTTRLNLLRLLNLPGANLWRREITLPAEPTIPDVQLDDVETHVALALRMRPDLNQARLEVQRGDLDIVKTKNGLLPELDLFITLGRTGYADSFRESVSDIGQDEHDWTAGVNFEYPIWNRAAAASYRRALLSRDQATEALGNQEQLAEVDVRSAYIEVNRTKEQVTATAATRKLQEENLRAEMEKFRVGKSTSLLVAQVQRDLLSAQIAEVQAVVSYIKAIVELYRLEGSLLERRGIAAPGREPVTLSDENTAQY